MLDKKTLALLILAAFALWLVLGQSKTGYSMNTAGGRTGGMQADIMGMNIDPTADYGFGERAAVGAGASVGQASYMGNEVASDEQFGSFSPDAILAGQNYLDPRQQIGFPETIGGNLRNANRQERSEPPNPRAFPSPWNLSTIPPDLMRPAFEIGTGTF